MCRPVVSARKNARMVTAVLRRGSAWLGIALALAVFAARWAPAHAAEAAAQVDWSKAESVTVVEVEYEFKPKHLSFRHGVPYRLHVENQGEEMHELTAPEFFRSALIKNP